MRRSSSGGNFLQFKYLAFSNSFLTSMSNMATNVARSVLLLFGPPGAGKGSFGVRIAERLRAPFLSMGDLLREQSAASKQGQSRHIKEKHKKAKGKPTENLGKPEQNTEKRKHNLGRTQKNLQKETCKKPQEKVRTQTNTLKLTLFSEIFEGVCKA